MEHYNKIILKGLIMGGVSSSEAYANRLITGVGSDKSESVSQMWSYIDFELQERIIEIIEEICRNDFDKSNVVESLIEHMSSTAGNKLFFSSHERSEIERMSDVDYENGKAEAVEKIRKAWTDKE
jgi:Txe/YoeB family toxin of Txe-Axe toxin-antitoxin module